MTLTLMPFQTGRGPDPHRESATKPSSGRLFDADTAEPSEVAVEAHEGCPVLQSERGEMSVAYEIAGPSEWRE